MPDGSFSPDTPVKIPLVTEPLGIFQTLRNARRNVLEIIPELCTKQPIVSGKTAFITFSGSDTMNSDAVHRSINAFIDQSARVSLFDVIGVPTWVPRLSRLFGGNPVADMKAVADQAITQRRASGAKEVPDLLDLLMDGIDPETTKQMNSAELRDNLLTFIVAGHETTVDPVPEMVLT